MKLFLKLFIFLLMSTQLAFAVDTSFESHQNLKNAVHAFLTTQLQGGKADFNIQVQNIDQRLKLKKCPVELEIKTIQAHVKPGKNTLNVECRSDTPWRIFMSAQVKLFTDLVVSRHPLNKGHLIQESDVQLTRVELTGRQSASLSSTKQVIGYIVNRRVKAGNIINANNLSKPLLIKKGDRVTILAKQKGFQISMEGIALMSGSKGDKIKIKNIKTKKIIQGIIFDAQTVKVAL
jgi:flagellar basal body P-ring formation protein FlgA